MLASLAKKTKTTTAQKYSKAAAVTLAGTLPLANIVAAKFTRSRSSKSFRFGSINK
jgi:hypothetical protein